jgi:hypothetical protein
LVAYVELPDPDEEAGGVGMKIGVAILFIGEK